MHLERVDHGLRHQADAGGQLVPVVGFGGEVGHEHPQVTFESDAECIELVGTDGAGLGPGKTDGGLGLVDVAVRRGRRIVFADPPAVVEARRAVVAFAGVDLHERRRAYRPRRPGRSTHRE